MASTQHLARRGVAALLFLSMIFINVLAIGDPPHVDTSRNGRPPHKGIADYANDRVWYRNIQTLAFLYTQAQKINDDLPVVSIMIERYAEMPEMAEAEQRMCRHLQNQIGDIVTTAKECVEIKRMIDEYLEKVNEELQCKDPLRCIRLMQTIRDLEEQFDAKDISPVNHVNTEITEYHSERVEYAAWFTQNIMKRVPTKSHSPDPGSEEVSGTSTNTRNGGAGSKPVAAAHVVSQTYGSMLVEVLYAQYGSLIQDNSEFVATKEIIRRFLNDQDELKQLDDLRNKANDIHNILRIHSVKEAYVLAFTQKYKQSTEDILTRSQQVYDMVCDNLIQINVAWDRAEKYNQIVDRLRSIDVDSPEVPSLIAVQEGIETEFEKYAFLINDQTFIKLHELYPRLLVIVRNFKSEVDAKQPPKRPNVSEETRPPLPSDEVPQTQPRQPAAAATPTKAAGGEDKVPRDVVKAKIIGSVDNNMRSESEKKNPSGHLVMGMTAIQTIVALYLIAIL